MSESRTPRVEGHLRLVDRDGGGTPNAIEGYRTARNQRIQYGTKPATVIDEVRARLADRVAFGHARSADVRRALDWAHFSIYAREASSVATAIPCATAFFSGVFASSRTNSFYVSPLLSGYATR